MSFRSASVPGIWIMILAHAGALAGCSGNVSEVEAQPLGRAAEEADDADDHENGTAVGATEGDGDGESAPPEVGDGDGDKLGCTDIYIPSVAFRVTGGPHEDHTACPVNVTLEGEGASLPLECGVWIDGCNCFAEGWNFRTPDPRFTISKNGVVLGTVGSLEIPTQSGSCATGPAFGVPEFQYVPAPTATDIATLYSDLRMLASTDDCKTANNCAAAPLGAKPCGGPWGYLVYSTLSTDEDDLLVRAEELAAAESQYNSAAGVSSDCAYMEAPEVVCLPDGCSAAENP